MARGTRHRQARILNGKTGSLGGDICGGRWYKLPTEGQPNIVIVILGTCDCAAQSGEMILVDDRTFVRHSERHVSAATVGTMRNPKSQVHVVRSRFAHPTLADKITVGHISQQYTSTYSADTATCSRCRVYV